MRSEYKYVLAPGYVRSRTDGQKHFISAKQLAWLYRVKIEHCFILTEHNHADCPSGLPFFEPRFDGNYPVFAQEDLDDC